MPSMKGRAAEMTSSGVRPKARSPITGFAGLLLMSRTGAKLRLRPSDASSLPIPSPTSRAVSPHHAAEAKRVIGGGVRQTRPPS